MEDDFIEDEYMEEEEGSSGSSRPFLVAVGALVTVFILAAVCTLLVMRLGSQGANDSVEIAAIETQNAITIVTNEAVAQFIAQTETAQAMPTNAPELAATNTPTPAAAKDTPRPTSVLEGSGGEGSGGEGTAGEGTVESGTVISGTAEATPEGGASGTIVIEEGAGSGDTGSGDTGSGDAGSSDGSTDSEAGGASGTDGSADASGTKGASSTDSGAVSVGGTPVSTATGSAQGGALPQTGLEIWVIAFAGLLLIAVLIAARRLRVKP